MARPRPRLVAAVAALVCLIAGSPVARAAQQAPQDQQSAPEAPRGGLRGYLARTTVHGSVEGYFGWHVNRQPTAALRNFDVNHNQISFSLAEVALEHKAMDGSRLGFRLDVAGGPTADMVNASEPGGPSFLKAVQQGYVSYLAPIGAGVQIDVGKFVTPLGAEVIRTRDNWNVSRSLLFTCAVPYYHFGARIGYQVSPWLAMTGFVVNGWNAVEDNNTAKTVALSAAVTPVDRLTVTQAVMVGAEQAGNDDDLRTTFNTVAAYGLTPRLALLGDVVYARDSVGTTHPTWYGAALALRYGRAPWAVSPRYEWYADESGFTTGAAQTVQEVTITGEYALGGFLTRLELRTDFSTEPVYRRGEAMRTTQTTLTLDVLYAFAVRK